MPPFSDLAAALRCWPSGREGEDVRSLGLDEPTEPLMVDEAVVLVVVAEDEVEVALSIACLPPKLALSNKNQSNQRVFFSE